MKADAVFPKFILTQLPAGLAGLVVSGVVAAAMSSIDSSLNAISATISADFRGRRNADTADDGSGSGSGGEGEGGGELRAARGASVAAAALSAAVAVALRSTSSGIIDVYNQLASALGGCTLALFSAAHWGSSTVFSPQGVTMAIGVSMLANVLLGSSGWVHAYYLSSISNALFIVLAPLFSCAAYIGGVGGNVGSAVPTASRSRGGDAKSGERGEYELAEQVATMGSTSSDEEEED